MTILLNEVSSYCLKRYCAGMSFAAPVNQFACSSFLGSSFIHQDMSVRSFMNRIVRVSNRSFACRTGLVAPSAFVRTFCTMLVCLRGRRTNAPKMRLFFVPLPFHGNGQYRLYVSAKVCYFQVESARLKSSYSLRQSKCSDIGIDCKHR